MSNMRLAETLNKKERERLTEILEYIKQNTEQIEVLGNKYFDSYYRYLKRLKEYIRKVNNNYRGLHLDLKISEYYELKLSITMEKFQFNIDNPGEYEKIRKLRIFNSKKFIARMFYLPKSSKSPLTLNFRYDRMD